MKEKITDELLREQKPQKTYFLIRDPNTVGFAAQILPTGKITFLFNYTFQGRERRYRIGQWGTWSVAAARNQAKELRRQVDVGIDPQGEKQADRAAPTVRGLFKAYKETHLITLESRNQKDIEAMWRDYILPDLGDIQLKNLTGRDIDRLHLKITTEFDRPVRANRVISNLRAAINKGIRWNMCDKNPAEGFSPNAEFTRDEYLSQAQQELFADALDRMPYDQVPDILRVLLLTGARLNEVLKMRWEDLDWELGRWYKKGRTIKQRAHHIYPIVSDVEEIVRRQPRVANSPYVFANPQTGKPRRDIKRAWKWLKREITLSNFRLHDLRHTFATIALTEGGATLEAVGRLLGHSQRQTTMRYAHLTDHFVRDAAANAVSATQKRGKLFKPK